MGIASRTFRDNGLDDEAKEMCGRIRGFVGCCKALGGDTPLRGDGAGYGFSMTAKREERMAGILAQIRRAVPDLDARIGQAQSEDGQLMDQAQWSQTM